MNEKVYKKFYWSVVVLASLIMFIGSIIHYHRSAKSQDNDFRVYYKTSHRIENKNWEEIYTRKDGPFPYRYIPYTLMTITWLDQFTEIEARKVWLSLQVLTFLAGFYYLYKSLTLLKVKEPLFIVCSSFLLMVRYYLDSLYCGQVAGLFFLSFSLGLYFYLRKEVVLSSVSNFFPATIKIAPGICIAHSFFKAEGIRGKASVVAVFLLIFASLNALFYGWLFYFHPEMNTQDLFIQLWKNWLMIVQADGEYYDGSSSKSQALRGVILRIFGRGESSERLWLMLVLFGVLTIFINWFLKKSKDLYSDACSYCLGIMAFILFMPQSLPYQVMNSMIPLAVVLSHPKVLMNKSRKILLMCFFLFLTITTSDLIGRKASDWVQAQSFPFIVLVAMTIFLFKDSWKEKVEIKAEPASATV